MPHIITYKMPRARKTSEFVVYPFTTEASNLKLQSDNHCLVVYVSGKNAGKTLVSKRFAQYPSFSACLPQNGGKVIDTPAEILAQLDSVIKNPTGKVVRLC